jgi:hypothetical protein
MRKTAAATSRDGNKAHIATCAECGCLSSLHWAGWGAYRVDDLRVADPPALAFFCPSCAEREFNKRAN